MYRITLIFCIFFQCHCQGPNLKLSPQLTAFPWASVVLCVKWQIIVGCRILQSNLHTQTHTLGQRQAAKTCSPHGEQLPLVKYGSCVRKNNNNNNCPGRAEYVNYRLISTHSATGFWEAEHKLSGFYCRLAWKHLEWKVNLGSFFMVDRQSKCIHPTMEYVTCQILRNMTHDGQVGCFNKHRIFHHHTDVGVWVPKCCCEWFVCDSFQKVTWFCFLIPNCVLLVWAPLLDLSGLWCEKKSSRAAWKEMDISCSSARNQQIAFHDF